MFLPLGMIEELDLLPPFVDRAELSADISKSLLSHLRRQGERKTGLYGLLHGWVVSKQVIEPAAGFRRAVELPELADHGGSEMRDRLPT